MSIHRVELVSSACISTQVKPATPSYERAGDWGGTMSVSENITQWSIHELSFKTSTKHHWNDFPLQVTYENGSIQIKLDAYWDMDDTWKARFAPMGTGTWRWKSSSVDIEMDGLSGSFNCIAPTSDQKACFSPIGRPINVATTLGKSGTESCGCLIYQAPCLPLRPCPTKLKRARQWTFLLMEQ